MMSVRRYRCALFAGSLALLVFPGAFLLLETPERPAAAAPPLSLEGLLDEKLPEDDGKGPELNVDNSSCYVCHGNLQEDDLANTHGMEDVACVDCHGQSSDHRNDEDNVTPPDDMYPRSRIDEMCQECHEDHDVPARKVLKRWLKRCPERTDPATVVCTDCHFHHRLSIRTVRWNKLTGKLLVSPPPEASNPAAEPGK